MQTATAQDTCRIVFWNVENLFDIYDDAAYADEEFTPQGEYHWTYERYHKKLLGIYKTIAALGNVRDGSLQGPMAIGLAEVENDKVLRELCRSTPLRKMKYDFIHFDSPDRRGIDNALLFRTDLFRPFFSSTVCVSDSSVDFFTRDILVVGGTTADSDTLIMLVNHFPSKRGGATADMRRILIAQRLRAVMDSLAVRYPSAAIIAMGDFNASPSESDIRSVLMYDGDGTYVNLMDCVESGRGSYKYQDLWSCLDQIIIRSSMVDGDNMLKVVSNCGKIFDAEFLLTDDDKYMGKKVLRTYLGYRYQGGFSDHLPVYIDLFRSY